MTILKIPQPWQPVQDLFPPERKPQGDAPFWTTEIMLNSMLGFHVQAPHVVVSLVTFPIGNLSNPLSRLAESTRYQ